MTRTTLPPKTSRLPRAAPWIAGGAIALGLAFGVGRYTAEGTPSAPRAAVRAEPGPGREEAPAPRYAAPATQPSAWTQAGQPAPAPPAAGGPSALPQPAANPVAPAAAARSTYRVPLPPGQLEVHKAEVVTHVEEQRKRVVQTCWPREGLPKGRRSTTVTYNVTFDPEGREVGRGIVQDRRAPAGKFGKCLGQLQGMPFSISPPGTYVTLRIPVSYP
jgi:hypothetical protein